TGSLLGSPHCGTYLENFQVEEQRVSVSIEETHFSLLYLRSFFFFQLRSTSHVHRNTKFWKYSYILCILVISLIVMQVMCIALFCLPLFLFQVSLFRIFQACAFCLVCILWFWIVDDIQVNGHKSRKLLDLFFEHVAMTFDTEN
uniref:Uncharacterized protein n=1 Tax=Poecilia reticulata TaxID=8081 RepID=A0A3P9P301_POERE